MKWNCCCCFFFFSEIRFAHCHIHVSTISLVLGLSPSHSLAFTANIALKWDTECVWMRFRPDDNKNRPARIFLSFSRLQNAHSNDNFFVRVPTEWLIYSIRSFFRDTQTIVVVFLDWKSFFVFVLKADTSHLNTTVDPILFPLRNTLPASNIHRNSWCDLYSFSWNLISFRGWMRSTLSDVRCSLIDVLIRRGVWMRCKVALARTPWWNNIDSIYLRSASFVIY